MAASMAGVDVHDDAERMLAALADSATLLVDTADVAVTASMTTRPGSDGPNDIEVTRGALRPRRRRHRLRRVSPDDGDLPTIDIEFSIARGHVGRLRVVFADRDRLRLIEPDDLRRLCEQASHALIPLGSLDRSG